MTPDEALRHEWILSGNTQKTNELRHSHSEAQVVPDSIYPSSSSTSGSSTYSRMHVKCIATKTSDKIKAKIVDSRSNNSTSVDSNLNDSGTFLPPIL